jgi:LytS/YehU family sensor histidine kinase
VLTLVENAVRHGIDPSESGGGSTSAPDTSPTAACASSSPTPAPAWPESAVPGTGLSNLESRLRGRYGAAGRLELHEARPHGLSAEIVFP